MLWQDYVFSSAAIAFSYALIPQIVKGLRERKADISTQTSIITSAGLYVCSITAYTLGLYLTTILYLVTAILWSILLYQSVRYRDN